MNGPYYDRIWQRKLSLAQYARLETRWRSRWEFALARVPQGCRVLDAGCGDGVAGGLLIEQTGCRVFGLDVSEYACRKARQRGVEALVCDISSQVFPLPPDTFDRVTMLCCLEHIVDPGHALRQAQRVIKTDGTVLVTLPNAVQWRFRLEFLKGRLSADLLHVNDGEGLHLRFFNYSNDFERLLESEAPGLEVIEKVPTLKNPRRFSKLRRASIEAAMRLRPNLFAEYSNFVLRKRVR